jgi:hypothetical protein
MSQMHTFLLVVFTSHIRHGLIGLIDQFQHRYVRRFRLIRALAVTCEFLAPFTAYCQARNRTGIRPMPRLDGWPAARWLAAHVPASINEAKTCEESGYPRCSKSTVET